MNERVSVNPEIARRSKYVKRIIAAVNYKGCEDHEDSHTILCDFQKEIKSEAYKEFAEGLKMRAINRYNEYDNQEFPYATITHIDNLLKELVGEDK